MNCMDEDYKYEGPKVEVQLVGLDGNVYAIIGRVREAMRKQLKDIMSVYDIEHLQKEYTDRATSGDYSHALCVTLEYVDEPETEDEDDDYYGEEDEEDDYYDECDED